MSTLAAHLVVNDTLMSPGAGLRSFPTTACDHGPMLCCTCDDCGNDCADCTVCEFGECALCVVPDLTPRTANTLITAGAALAAQVREAMSTSPRAVFLDHLLGAIEESADHLRNGRRPRPTTLAEQLCLHLMISYATDLACSVGEVFNVDLPSSDYDYYFDRLYDTLLADDEHMRFISSVEPPSTPDRIFDFSGLATTASDAAIAELLAPLAEPWPGSITDLM